MSRRRTGTRYVPITISLRPWMVDDIEAVLDAKQSRSQWIADAIKKKMDDDERTLNDATLLELRIRFHKLSCGCEDYSSCPNMSVLRRMSDGS